MPDETGDDAEAERRSREEEALWSRGGGDGAGESGTTDEPATQPFDPSAFPPPAMPGGGEESWPPGDDEAQVPPARETETQQLPPAVPPVAEETGEVEREVVRDRVVEERREVVEEQREVVDPAGRGGLRAPAVAPQRETPWWLWLVGALVLLALAVVIVVTASDDEPDVILASEAPSLEPSESELPTEEPSLLPSELDEGTITDSSESPVPGLEPDPDAFPEATATAQDEEAVVDGDNPEDLPGEVLVGSTSILPLPPEGLTPFRGRTARATLTVVQQVVGGSGFWVGPSEEDRLFVLLEDGGELPGLAEGDLVSFEAEVVANDDDLSQYGIDEETGAELLDEQGSHLEALSEDVEVREFSDEG